MSPQDCLKSTSLSTALLRLYRLQVFAPNRTSLILTDELLLVWLSYLHLLHPLSIKFFYRSEYLNLQLPATRLQPQSLSPDTYFLDLSFYTVKHDLI